MKIVLIDNYDSFTFNVYHYLKKNNCRVDVVRNDKFKIKDIKKYDKIVISPGPGNPSQAGLCLKTIETYKEKKPILGICLGHQAIAQSFGSKIIKSKELMHGKTSRIINNQKAIFKNLPKILEATRYHSLIVDKKTLSNELEITAKTQNNIIMGIQHKKLPIFGIQFHPESYKTSYGQKIINNFVNL